jgi:phosphocarrier protein
VQSSDQPDQPYAGGELCELVTIMNERGLHARAAAKFVKTAEPYQCEISVAKGDSKVSGRSIMGLMMLAASQGTRLKICASGADAPDAVMAIVDLIKRKFDEN